MVQKAERRPPGRRRLLRDPRVVAVYLDAPDLARLQQFSDARGASISSLARNLLLRYIATQGY